MINKKLILFLCLTYCCSVHSQESICVSAPNSIWAEEKGTKIQGPIIEIAKEIFSELGVSVNAKAMPWARSMHHLRNGKLDAMLVVNRTKERDEYIEYSIAYANIPVSVFVLKGSSFSFSNLRDLIGKKGLFIQGQQFGQTFEKFKPQLSLHAITTPRQMVTMLSVKRADYAIANNYAFISEARRLELVDRFETLPHTISQTPIHIGFSKKSKFVKYLDLINIKISKMVDEGIFKQIIHEAINSPSSSSEFPNK